MSATGRYKGIITDIFYYQPPAPPHWALVLVQLDIYAGVLSMQGAEARAAVAAAEAAGWPIKTGMRVVVTLHASISSKTNPIPDQIATLEVAHGGDALWTGVQWL